MVILSFPGGPCNLFTHILHIYFNATDTIILLPNASKIAQKKGLFY